MSTKATWGFVEGDLIAPGLHAMKLLGGGYEYEAYLAWDDYLFALIVAKVVRPDRIQDDGIIKQFLREADTLARLSHPVIVRSFRANMSADRPHLVLEHLEGRTLRSLLKRHGPLPLAQLLPLALEMCSALHYLAEEQTIHLDVKPGNIVMGAPPRLIDLSVARTFDEARTIRRPIGTDEYMAPEQCLPDAAAIGAPTDMWGLGATLYQALTGNLAFTKGNRDSKVTEIRFPQVKEEPTPLPEGAPKPLAEVLMRALDKDPQSRPSPKDFTLALESLVAAMPRRPVLRRGRPRIR